MVTRDKPEKLDDMVNAWLGVTYKGKPLTKKQIESLIKLEILAEKNNITGLLKKIRRIKKNEIKN